jgi:hypothetical protein
VLIPVQSEKFFGVSKIGDAASGKKSKEAAAKVTANKRPCEESSIVMTSRRLVCRMRGCEFGN